MKIYWPAVRVGGLFLAAALTPVMAGAQATTSLTASRSPSASVSRVSVDRAGQDTTVRVLGKGGRLVYHVTRLSDPSRLVLDFDGAGLSFDHNAVPGDSDPVRGVRLGQSRPDSVRMVIDLARPAAFTVDQSDPSGLSLTLTFSGADSTASPAAVAHAIAPVSPLLAPGARKSLRVMAPPAIAAHEFPLPATLTGNAVGFASPEPPAPQAPAQGTKGPLAGSVELASAQVPDASGLPAPPPAVKYSGEPISVNLKDVDLKDFFRLIHEISGLNVVLDPSVHGTVTLVLDEVPWDQALDIVLRNNGLSKEISGNVLRIATSDTVKKEATDKRDIQKAQSEAVEPVTVTRVLSYAKASELVAPLKRFLSTRGDVIAIDRSNTLIIRDIPVNVSSIDTLIRQLDRKSQQVEIQARVVQASRSFARDIGTQFGAAGVATTANSANFLGGAPSLASPIVHTPQPPVLATGSTLGGTTGSIPLLSSLPANAPTSGFEFSHVSPNFALDLIITAAESKGVGKLLSSPQLVTQNNAQAIVKQGAQIPIQTTINNTISVQYIDAVLRLQVTPQITADGTVFMDVLVENTQVDNGIPLVNGVPALNTQSAQTKVLINDGGTVVIGGVMVSQQQTSIKEVPLVGSIPLIGHLFRETSVSVSSQELLFFLTPRILPG